mmetsp:Transcript_128290/g.273548  ORF Transcript_128290/g.273548 Transcript_128290/m.273548 type:complete len:206 (-) Transcript_128290:144-761(-)
MHRSTSHNTHGFPSAARPIITPTKFGGASLKMPQTSSNVVMPPFSVNWRCGKSLQRRSTRSYISGGIRLFCSGVRPFRRHFRAWTMKCLTPDSATVCTKFAVNSGESKSSQPSRHFTVTGSCTASAMARTQSRTSSGLFIRDAPNSPLPQTLSEGHPQLRLISSYPQDSTIFAAAARVSGLLPPSWQTIGCSSGPKSRNPSTLSA